MIFQNAFVWTKKWALSMMMMLVASGGFGGLAHAELTTISVEITNHADAGGASISPVWVGFHNGSFDLFDTGGSASLPLSRLAEDGNLIGVDTTFNNNLSPVLTDVTQIGQRISGVLGDFSIAPGDTATATFDLDLGIGGANQFLSFGAQIQPSNDYFIGNDDPTAIDLSSLSDGGSVELLLPVTVFDAGTEINDFATSNGNGLVPAASLPDGQLTENVGQDQFGVINEVLSPFVGFANTPTNADVDPGFAALNFVPSSLVTVTIAPTSVVAVPEPSFFWGAALLVGGIALRRHR